MYIIIQIKIRRSIKIQFNKSLKRRKSYGIIENADCRRLKNSREITVLAKPPLESGIFTTANFIQQSAERFVKGQIRDAVVQLQMRSKDCDAVGNIAEPKGHICCYNVDISSNVVVQPRRA